MKSSDRPDGNPDADTASSMDRTVRMMNLRYEIKSEQLEAFFKDYNPEPGSVCFIMQNGMPTGKWVFFEKHT